MILATKTIKYNSLRPDNFNMTATRLDTHQNITHKNNGHKVNGNSLFYHYINGNNIRYIFNTALLDSYYILCNNLLTVHANVHDILKNADIAHHTTSRSFLKDLFDSFHPRRGCNEGNK